MATIIRMLAGISSADFVLKCGDVVTVDDAHGTAWIAEGMAEACEPVPGVEPIVWPPPQPVAPEPVAEAAAEHAADAEGAVVDEAEQPATEKTDGEPQS